MHNNLNNVATVVNAFNNGSSIVIFTRQTLLCSNKYMTETALIELLRDAVSVRIL